jgi:hypothetical protein
MENQESKNVVFPSRKLTKRFQMFVGALVCALAGGLMTLAVIGLWQMGKIPATSSLEEQMMHRKTRTMERILDGLVRGDLRRVEASAEQMQSIGQALNWYLSLPVYERNDEIFRDSTLAVLEAARQGDYAAAKESALRLERSCIECHGLIYQANPPIDREQPIE